MNEIPDLDSKIRIATQIDYFEKRYWEMIKELHAKNDMLEEQAKEIEKLKADLNIEKECYDKIEKHNLYLENKHKHFKAIVIEKNKEIEQLKLRELSNEKIAEIAGKVFYDWYSMDDMIDYAREIIKASRGEK